MIWFLAPLILSAQPTEWLTSIAAVRGLDRERAAQKLLVEVTAVVTHVNAEEGVFFLQDATSAVCVLPTLLVQGLAIGDQVTVAGVTDRGTFAPVIRATAVMRGRDAGDDLRRFSGGAGTTPRNSRHTDREMQPIDLVEVLRDCEKLIRPALGDGIRFTAQYAERLPTILADRGLITQVILNLATNARDAMDGHGEWTLSVEPATQGETPLVRLRVSDTGTGMDDNTKARIFEPFFTTKAVGKGTGLGLASVYGIVHQLGGAVAVESEVGRGTTFTIDFPSLAQISAPDAVVQTTPLPVNMVGPILLVDDDSSVRHMMAAVLRQFGQEVTEAASAVEALDLVRNAAKPFAILIADVVMQDLSGPQLVEQVRAMTPTVGVIFVSGYARQEIPTFAFFQESDRFLKKPFSPLLLLSEVQDLSLTLSTPSVKPE